MLLGDNFYTVTPFKKWGMRPSGIAPVALPLDPIKGKGKVKVIFRIILRLK